MPHRDQEKFQPINEYGVKIPARKDPIMFTPRCEGRHPMFSFERQIKFSAYLDLAFAHNQSFVQQLQAIPQRDRWQKQPPDFSYKLYTSSTLSRKAPGKDKEGLDTLNNKEPETKQCLPRIDTSQFYPALQRKKELPKLVTRFPRIGSFEAAKMFVENGKYKSGIYRDPKPHDFRQYETNIPNFVTSYPRDPFNLKFKSQHLNIVCGLQPLTEKQMDPKGRFITCKPRECKWESRLILPKTPWPPKSASFTRHRKRRDAYTAFLDRVDEKLRTTLQEEACQSK
ncbi:putative uncharacterized protein C7orf78 homolog isoform X1 [Pelodiscus sinensis]|uniref:putative uncharacterized protein C7orf78 homolog isoform X1 n=2 Tax=Pelodiscus sinensis TaxID=13735 RepID=UPI003F6BE81E